MPHRPCLNVAHRGARAFAPENTLSAIRLARRLGADVVELDVQMSRDGELVVLHDDEVTRCSDAREVFPGRADYSVASFTWEELSRLDAGGWYVAALERPTANREPPLHELLPGEIDRWVTRADLDEYRSGAVRIPHLREALDAARACRLAVMLDVKTIPRRYPDIARNLLDVVGELDLEREVLIASFDHTLLAEVRLSSAEVATGVLTAERLHRPREYVLGLDADVFLPGCDGGSDVIRRGLAPDDVDADAIRELTDAGLLVCVWTENRASRMRLLIDAGVSGIVTDCPNRLRAVAGEMKPGVIPGFRRRGQPENPASPPAS